MEGEPITIVDVIFACVFGITLGLMIAYGI